MNTGDKNEYMRAYWKTERGGLYSRWRLMVRRCCDPTHHNWPLYGARGITVCEDWKDFQEFYEWGVKSGFKTGLQIDRIDNSKGYYPDNCRWVTSAKNNQNRRNNKLDDGKINEIRALLKAGVSGPKIAKQYGVHHSMIYRIKLDQAWKRQTKT